MTRSSMDRDTPGKVLVVDDEADLRELLSLSLLRMGLDCETAGSVAEARGWLGKPGFALVLTDMNLPDGTGVDVVELASAAGLPVAVITAFGSAETAVAALKAGAFDYVEKPIEFATLKQLIGNVFKPAARREDKGPAREGVRADVPSLQGESRAIAQVRELIARLARTMAPVAISGPSGSGKELAARSIHAQGGRAGGPFIAVNCGAIPEHLMEAEFFGYRKGAFTGANEDRDGFFQAANGGTLLLDEVADLPLAMQVKLLRAIQERKVRKVGATVEEPVDVRLISATHKDLAKLVAAGAFRQDLYYRLNVIELKMPPLAERAEDIPLLARHLLARIAERHGTSGVKLMESAQSALTGLRFPGNVRELENVLERAVALSDGAAIDREAIQLAARGLAPLDESDGGTGASPAGLGDTPSAVAAPAGAAEVAVEFPLDLEAHLDAIERKLIEQALLKTRYNRTQAAELLGLSFRQFRYRLQRLGIK
ncbi:MAG TPA: sigma-54 dependent transcriptional regulator [Burkholderiaceae bacterium]|nr:sigma-54 dependent transcriptional regulator [Burkholderiaceae bacterium]